MLVTDDHHFSRLLSQLVRSLGIFPDIKLLFFSIYQRLMQHYRKSHFIKTQDDCILSVLSIYQTQTSKDRELFYRGPVHLL